MHLPVFSHLVFATFMFGVWLAAPTRVHAQDCLGSGSSYTGLSADQGSSTDFVPPDSLSQDFNTWIAASTSYWQSSGNPAPPDPINVTINCSTTIYAQSPTSVSSTAWTSSTPISLHTIEYINQDGSSGGFWTIDIASGSGTSDQRSIGVTFPSPGTYLVRSGASADGGNTWTYSDQVSVTVNDCINIHTVTIQTIPKPGMEKWFRPSNVASKTFRVRHTNPYP
jgi:hypothetical protein